MKPVPFAQFLAQRQHEAAPEDEGPPVRAKALNKPLTWPQAVKQAEASERPRPSPLLRKVEAEAPDDKAAHSRRIEQGRLIAFEDGRQAERKELAEERARMREQLAAEVARERTRWAEEEAERLLLAHRDALADFETRCAQAVANILRPFLTELAIARVTDALVENLDALFAARAQTLFDISGPADLLDALRRKYADRDASIVFRPDESIDVRVRVDDTIIETRLGVWMEALGALPREARAESGDE